MAKFKKGDRIQVHDTSDLRSDKVANEIGTVVKFAGKEGKEDVWLIKFDKRRVNMNLGDTDMDKLKESKLNESDLRQLIRAMVEQEMDKTDVDDEEDKFDVTEKCKKDEELEIELDEMSSVTGMAGGESYQTPYAFAKRLRDRTREISQQLGYKLVNDPEDRDWKDIEDAQKESLVYRKKFAEMKVRSGLKEGKDEIVKIFIGNDPYWLRKMGDTTHFHMANSLKGIKAGGWTYHVGQHKDELYYNDLVKWLKGGKINGKKYKGFFRVLSKEGVNEVKYKGYDIKKQNKKDAHPYYVPALKVTGASMKDVKDQIDKELNEGRPVENINEKKNDFVAEMKVNSGLTESTLTDLKKLLKKDGWKDVKVKRPERNIEYVANMEKGKKFVTIYKEKGEEDEWMMVQYGSEYGDEVDSLDQKTLRNIKRELIGENINETNIGKKGSIKSIGTWIKILKAATKGQYTFDKDDMRDLIDSLKNISQSIEALNEGRRGAYQNYRDDSDKTPRQKIGEAIRGVRDQLQEIEKTIDLNLRLKQETGIDSQKYWKNTHRALSKINERMTRIINKVRRF